MTTTFFSYNALLSQRASGYKNTTYALAELIDNSFDADADTVTIVFLEKRVDSRRRVDEILVLDNGKGMSEAVLQGALQFGNTTNKDIAEVVKSKKKGKFGYGLPNASLSQCPSIHVYSWVNAKQKNHVFLDLDELEKSKSIEIPPVQHDEFPAHYSQVLPIIGKSGTLVSWRKCDRLSHTKGDSIVNNSLPVIGRLYRYLLAAGRKIEFAVFEYNSDKKTYIEQRRDAAKPNDPLFLMKDTVLAKTLWQEGRAPSAKQPEADHYAKYARGLDACDATNERLIDHCYSFDFSWRGRAYQFEITTSTAKLDIQKPGIREGGSTKVGEIYGKKENEGNISFVRADREIAAGSFGFYGRADARHRWWSIEVRFDADADDLLGVHNNKQGVEFTFTKQLDHDEEFNEYTAELLQAREAFWSTLTAKIVSAQKEAFKSVKKQGSDWDARHLTPGGGTAKKPAVPRATATTERTIRTVDGQREKQLTPTQRTELEDRLIEKYKDIPPAEIRQAVEALDRSLTRACVLYAPAEAKQLWSYTKVYDFTVVLVNTNHEFYTRILGEFRASGQEGALTAVELFLSSLAIEEEKFSEDNRAKDIVEDFRERVGSHLHRYIRSLPENMSLMPSSVADIEEDDDE